MKSGWTIKKLSEIADFNPRESLQKGTIAKKVGNRIIQIRNSNSHDSIGQRQIEQPMGPTK